MADKESANMHRESTGLYKIIKITHLENNFYFKHTSDVRRDDSAIKG